VSLAALLPIRTRLSLTGASLAAHLVALSAFALVQTSPAVLAPLNIDVIPQGDYIRLPMEDFGVEHFSSFAELWQPNPANKEMIWWVSSSKAYHYSKRAIDIMLAVMALILLSPLFVVVAILIKLDSPGQVFFIQTRVGKWGKLFSCFKFRSMYVDAEARKSELASFNEADGPVFKIKDDPRITRIGRIIRKWSLDEIPQLINVLRGDMSLVGPRPPLPSEVARYQYYQLRRLDVKPGITGLQQVSGRSDLDFKEWISLDIEYIERRSLGFDLLILLRTIPAVLSTRGAY
jgi:exopolysaccharide biosynthesis polyprenyl glycosylphosphotransferase